VADGVRGVKKVLGGEHPCGRGTKPCAKSMGEGYFRPRQLRDPSYGVI